MGSKEFRSSDGKISVKLYGPDSAFGRKNSGILRHYDWKSIVGILRELVRYLRDSPSLRGLKPAKDRDSYIRACAARTFVGQHLSLVWHCFRIDPRRDDGIGVDDNEVSDTLRLCLQEETFLQGAAMDLWVAYRAAYAKLSDAAVPWLDEPEIVRLEQAIETVASMTVDEQTGAQPTGASEAGGSQCKLKPSQEKAYSQYKNAIAREPRLAEGTDEEVYEFVRDNLLDDDERLPKPEAWKKYVRAGRTAHGERKNQPRAGRSGRSVVRTDEL